jgi:hypothetical protein
MPDLRLYKNKAEGAVKLGHVNNVSHLSWKMRILRCMQLGERLGVRGKERGELLQASIYFSKMVNYFTCKLFYNFISKIIFNSIGLLPHPEFSS